MEGVSGPNFEGYIESWQGEDANMAALKKMQIDSNTTINISFCSFDFSSGSPIPGLEFTNNAQALKDIVTYIHSKGGHVKISFGGATYPLAPSLQTMGPEKLAQDIANVVKTYDLDGVDLDIEDHQTDSTSVVEFMKNLNQDLGSTEISLTVPGQDWGAKNWITACAPYVTKLNFMEYDIWIPEGGSVVNRIEEDINTYINDWGIPANKIQLGLMPGKDDVNHNLSLQDAKELGNWAVKKGLAGVMIWDINRDEAGIDGQESLAYTNALEKILEGH